MQGTIIKGIAGFYYIKTADTIIECKARGRFRYDELTPMVGDIVEITVKNNKGVIDKISKRSSELVRPSVANVTQAYVIFSLVNPDLNLDLLNKFLIICEYHNLKVTVCFNKLDLISDIEAFAAINMVKKSGYKVVFLKAKERIGLQELMDDLQGNITVFCGPSGVGKSTILNNLVGREAMETGSISEKSGRGKHTTRHSELIEVNNGFVVDTPGFSSLELDFIPKNEFQWYFPEFSEHANSCKFNTCVHHKEPDCAVKKAVLNKEICEERYDFYVRTLEQLSNGRNTR